MGLDIDIRTEFIKQKIPATSQKVQDHRKHIVKLLKLNDQLYYATNCAEFNQIIEKIKSIESELTTTRMLLKFEDEKIEIPDPLTLIDRGEDCTDDYICGTMLSDDEIESKSYEKKLASNSDSDSDSDSDASSNFSTTYENSTSQKFVKKAPGINNFWALEQWPLWSKKEKWEEKINLYGSDFKPLWKNVCNIVTSEIVQPSFYSDLLDGPLNLGILTTVHLN